MEMKLKWKPELLTAIVLALALAGCSSSDSTTPQQAQSAPDTFRKYSANLHETDFRQALRNSWVGTSGTSETRVMDRNERQDSKLVPQGAAVDFFLDIGKDICKGAVESGLSYAVDSAFGIQSKSQKQADETDFINDSLLGIQHQLTAINANLETVYTNQTKAMSQQAIDQLQNVRNFASLSDTIFALSGVETTFNTNYGIFQDDLEKGTTGPPDYDLNFQAMCDPTQGFIKNNYSGINTGNPQDTILYDAYNLMECLFGNDPNMKDKAATGVFNGLIQDSKDYMTDLKTATGINAIANYYAYGTCITQAAFNIADILQQAYTVFAFTLQFATQCDAVKNFYSGTFGTPGHIYDGIDISTLTPDKLSDALNTLRGNFKTQYGDNAKGIFQQLAQPYGNGDVASLLAAMEVSLADDFMQSGCFPLSFVKNVNNNGNLDYLAAECNYNGNWTVLQLYIPTNNGAESLINIRYLTDPKDFGLVGYIDDPVLPLLSQPSTIHRDGTCDSHYKDTCTCGFSDCYVVYYSIALNGSEPLYGAGEIFELCGSTYVKNPDFTGLNYRYQGDLCNCGFDGDSCSSGTDYVSAITSNGHVFAGTMTNKYARNETMHGMFCTNAEFGVMPLTETGAGVNGNILSYPDGTKISANGPFHNASGENGNTDTELAEYGFEMALQSSPQPDAASYPICAEGRAVFLDGFYPDSINGSGTVTDATSISVTLDDGTVVTGTFDTTETTDTPYDTLTLSNNQIWKKFSASSGQQARSDAMQGLWVYPDQQNIQAYMTISCGSSTE